MNIAEILKYCPKGTKLYSLVNGEVTLESVTNLEHLRYPIEIITNNHKSNFYTKDGLLYDCFGECVLFPSRDQRDWNKFRLPVKDGDIMMTIDKRAFITNGKINNDGYPCAYCGIDLCHNFTIGSTINGWTASFYIPALEEAKKELFDKMKEAGYRWNADTLELEKIEPQFKEGDIVVDRHGNLCLVSKVENSITIIVRTVLYTDGTLKIYNDNDTYRLSKETTLASIEERNRFYSTLTKEGYIYDKEQHKFIKQD